MAGSCFQKFTKRANPKNEKRQKMQRPIFFQKIVKITRPNLRIS